MARLVALTRLLTAAALLLLVPSVAAAHITLTGSEPSAASTVMAPARIALRFTLRPQLGFSHIELIGPAGGVALAPLVADSANGITAGITGTLTPGAYAVRWRTASADGHVIRGEFGFTVAAPGPAPGAAPALAPQGTDSLEHVTGPEAHVQHGEYRWARWMEFVALITVLGALAFRHGVLPPLAARGVPTADAADRARRLGQNSLVLYVAAAAYRLWSESAAVHGRGRALAWSSLEPLLTRTTWGIGWLAGIGGAALLVAGWRHAKGRSPLATPLALLGGAALAFAPALSGHAAAGEPMLLSVGADVLHVLTAGAWTGGLLMVVMAGLPSMRRIPADVHGAVAALVNSFHPLALFCAPLAVLTGVTSAWLRLGSAGALWSSDYGRTLLVKLAVFAAVAVVGGFNALRVRRQLGSAEASRRIRTTAIVELVLVAALLAVTTWLVVTPIPADAGPA